MVYTLKIYVDGGCRGIGKPGSIGAAAAYLIRKSGETKVYTRNLPRCNKDGNAPTNQRAEIMAIGTAFELLIKELKELDDLPWFDVEILSDSRYAIGCMTEWAYKWKSNGWRNAAGAPIANQKLIKQVLGFDDAFSEIADITYTWIPRSENKMADRLCNQALDEQEEVQRKKEAARRANQEAAQRAEASARRSREDEARRVKEEAARRARVEALRIAREEAEERTREEAEERRPSIRIHSNRAVPFGHTNTPHDETVSVDFFMSSLSFGP